LTATPSGSVAPVMKLWFAPPPSWSARPIVLPSWLVQKMCSSSTATPAALLAPVMKFASGLLPSAFTRPIVPAA
jgi:hypothetical protein